MILSHNIETFSPDLCACQQLRRILNSDPQEAVNKRSVR